MVSRRKVLGWFSVAPLSACTGGAPLQGQEFKARAGFVWAAPQFSQGERWNYRLLDGFNKEQIALPSYQVADTAQSVITFEVKDLGDQQRTHSVERLTADGSVLEEPTFDSPIVYAQAQPLLNSNVRDGWQRSQTRYSTPDDQRGLAWNQTIGVRRFETTTVPAGTFETALIERTINFTHSDTFRTGSSRVDRLWYSPKAKRWVKREWQGSYYEIGESAMRRGAQSTMREIWRIWELTSQDAAPIASKK
jgi:hypothetical protein